MKKLDFNFICVICVLFSTTLVAQKIEYVCGEYTYPASIDVTTREARQMALERAKIDAIGKMFGITVSEQTFLDKRDENGKLSTSFRSFGGTEARGEWVKDSVIIEHPPNYDNNLRLTMHKVSVCGLAREITTAGVDFLAMVLRNGTENRFESSEFRNGDDIYLAFRSPVEGYLAAYLIDDAETAYCLLPYMNDPTGRVKVKNGKDYIFFSAKHADNAEKAIVNEYVMTCEKTMEHNFLYIIFSPNEFTKANDVWANEGLPRQLSFADFQRWLTLNSSIDKNFKWDRRSLTIKK
jgi:hypothetical protein